MLRTKLRDQVDQSTRQRKNVLPQELSGNGIPQGRLAIDPTARFHRGSPQTAAWASAQSLATFGIRQLGVRKHSRRHINL